MALKAADQLLALRKDDSHFQGQECCTTKVEALTYSTSEILSKYRLNHVSNITCADEAVHLLTLCPVGLYIKLLLSVGMVSRLTLAFRLSLVLMLI